MKDHATKPATPSKARLRLWLRLLRVTRTMEAEIRETLRREHDTTLPRFDVMAALNRAPDGLKMSELSGRLRVSNGNVTGIIDRLVQDALVERRAVPGDRRAMRVCLTDQGRTAFTELATHHEAWIDDLLGGIDGIAADSMAETLRDIADRLDKRTPE